MLVVKLLTRIVAPEEVLQNVRDETSADRTLHDHTYGITSDPLTQFAVAFSVSARTLFRAKIETLLIWNLTSYLFYFEIGTCA